MEFKTADDIEMFVESMNWRHSCNIEEIVEKLNIMNEQDLRAARALVNRRVWDETFDDEMAAKARWHYMKTAQVFADAIWEWQKREES